MFNSLHVERMEWKRQETENPVQTEQSKMAEAEDEIIAAHEVCKHLALRYVY